MNLNATLKKCCYLLLALLFTHELKAQSGNPYQYQDLSDVVYRQKKDSIKKFWACPSLYSDKATQKKYKEIWDSRIDFITSAIENKSYLHEKEIYNYISAIMNELFAANPKYAAYRPFLLLDRSSAVNAYAIGGNIIAVNMGLVDFVESREELALVIAHELSHNILEHPDNSIKEKAEWLTSAEYKNQLNNILDSKYERYSRLKKILENYSFSRNRHNRYHENEADSLAIQLLKNTHIGFYPEFFLRLDSADMQYRKTLKRPVKDYFADYHLSVEDWWLQKRSKGLSTRSYNFTDAAVIEDSLKTHPDCKERYLRTLSLAAHSNALTPLPPSIKSKAKKIMLWNMFDNYSLTACMYNILLEKDKENKDAWYDFMFANIISGMYYSDKQLNRFHAISIMPKEYLSKDYYGLQTMFEQIPKDNLQQFYTSVSSDPLWQKMPADAKAINNFFATLTSDDQTEKKRTEAIKAFTDTFSESMYCEFPDHFKKH